MPAENTITLTPDITGPNAPASQPPANDPKLPSEEERKQPEAQPVQPEAPAAETPPANPVDELAAKAQEAKDVLAPSGIDYETLEAEYAKEGQISEASYEALAKAGYSKKLVDTFIAGMEADAIKAQVLQEKEVDAIKATVGGTDAYTQLTLWAKENLSQAERDGYDAIMATNNVDAIKMAVVNLQTRYEAVMGRDPRYVNSQGTAPAPQDVYQSMAEASRDMADPRYSKDPAYRMKVEAKLIRSSI